MPLGNVPLSARVYTLLGFESPEPRTAASYERELAAHKATESELRKLSPATRRCFARRTPRSANRRC